MKKISQKIILITIGSAMLISIALGSLMAWTLFRSLNDEIDQLGATLLEDFDLLIRSEVETMLSIVKIINADRLEGEIGFEEARGRAAHLVRESRYGKDGYFWVDDSNGNNVVLLGNDTEGTNRLELQDTQGKFMIKEFIARGMEGGGYTDYFFPKSGGEIPLPKRGYSLYFEPFDWIIGTGNYIDDIDLILEEKARESKDKILIYATYFFIGLIVILVLVVVAAFILGRRISQPIVYAVSVAELTASGDLRHKHNNQYSRLNDEVGTLLDSLMLMQEKLSHTIASIHGSAKEVSSGAEQISLTTQNLATGANQQAASVEEISSSMEELSSNIQQNRENSNRANEISRKISSEAIQGGESVRKTVEAMEAISAKISIIDDIARNTNMLALNAAIEAARAGEAGKGFAVVASEVRKLAENSGRAAGEIMEISQSSLDIARQAGEIISDLVPQIGETSQIIQEINIASREQSAGADQINQGIQELDKVIQQNAASSEELAAMAEELSSQSSLMEDNTAYFKTGSQLEVAEEKKENRLLLT